MSQPNRVEVRVASGDDLDVRSFAVRQRLSELFRVEVRVVSSNPSVALEEVVGKEASFSLATQWSSRTLTGVCIEMEQVRVERDHLTTYVLAIAPRLWLLTQRKNYRVFQYLSELEIVRQILGEWGVLHEARIGRSHKARKFRVQYDETDFAFVCRMLEDAGITFSFEPSAEGTTLVLDDQPETRDLQHPALAYRDSPGVTDGRFVTRVSVLQRVRPGRMTIGDLDYRRAPTSQPRLSAARGLAPEAPLEQFDYEPGAFLYQASAGGRTPFADDRGTARTDEGAGAEKTADRLLARRQGDKCVRFLSNVIELSPGSILGIAGHPHRVVGGSHLLVTSSLLDGEHDGEWRVHSEAASAAVPYRPAQITPKPRMPGLESATVVGPAGEEIHTDEYGRVRVHFHWDRESQRSESTSCWVPTSQPWAGTSFGGINLPRIGQEVLVEFLGGDPDRPVVIGRVYTETNPPPDKLPKFKTVSGLVSESTPRMVMGAADGGAAGAATSPLGGGTPMSPGDINGLVTQPGPFQAASPTGTVHNWQGSGIKFDDEIGKQMVYLQAQRDFNIVVNDCWRTIVGNRRTCKVGTDDQLTIQNFHDTSVTKDQGLRVVGNQKLTVSERRAEEVRGNLGLEVGPGGFHIESSEERINYQASKGLLIESKKSIEIVVKGSHIIIEPAMITINSGHKVILQAQEGKGG